MGYVTSRLLSLFVALQLLAVPLAHVTVDHCPDGDCHGEHDDEPHDECGDCGCPCQQATAAISDIPAVGLAAVTRHAPAAVRLDLPPGFTDARKPPPKA